MDRKRLKILDMIYTAKKGHIGGSFSCVEILEAVYDVLGDDKFILSKGHAAPALYVELAERYPIDLDTYCQEGGLESHPNMNTQGIEVNAGSLGHLGVACGMALNGQKVYVLMGDGECQEGSVWEAAGFASKHELDITVIVDANCLGSTQEVNDDLIAKWRAFNWYVVPVAGHYTDSIKSQLHGITPRCIIAYTTKGKGVSFMENKIEWHHKIPTEAEYEMARDELNGH